VTWLLNRKLVSRATLCLVSGFAHIVTDCPKIRNLPFFLRFSQEVSRMWPLLAVRISISGLQAPFCFFMVIIIYRARQKVPLGKILYLWNCSSCIYQICRVYRRGFSLHILQILLK